MEGEIIETKFHKFCRIVKKITVVGFKIINKILENKIVQFTIMCYILSFMNIQLFKACKFGIFKNCKDETVHNNYEYKK